MSLTLESIGLTQEELQERVVETLCNRLLTTFSFDDEGEAYGSQSNLRKQLDKRIQERIDQTINALAEKHVLPNVTSYLENLCLQETNKWGEKQGQPLTFIEYLVSRAEHYMAEQVDFQGKTKEKGDYNWSGKQTRVAYLVHQHLQYSIENAMKQAIADANKVIVGGLQETVKLKLNEVASKLQVSVSTGR